MYIRHVGLVREGVSLAMVPDTISYISSDGGECSANSWQDVYNLIRTRNLFKAMKCFPANLEFGLRMTSFYEKQPYCQHVGQRVPCLLPWDP